jgi:hypothetical protein
LIDNLQIKNRFELTMGPKIYGPGGFEMQLWSAYLARAFVGRKISGVDDRGTQVAGGERRGFPG